MNSMIAEWNRAGTEARGPLMSAIKRGGRLALHQWHFYMWKHFLL